MVNVGFVPVVREAAVEGGEEAFVVASHTDACKGDQEFTQESVSGVGAGTVELVEGY